MKVLVEQVELQIKHLEVQEVELFTSPQLEQFKSKTVF